MNEIKFLVQGSASEPYQVEFIRKDKEQLIANCNCPAGSVRRPCKHRFSILEGSRKGVVSDNKNDVEIVLDWLVGTELEEMLNQLSQLEKQMDLLKNETTKKKKLLAKVMCG